MHKTEPLTEAGRLMTICNSCRYCEGLCAVFPAMELRRDFAGGDLNYIANLCHGCGACYADCQFSPPHEFDVNVPKTLAKVRADSWQAYAWPASLRPLFERNGLVIAALAAVSVAAFLLGFVAWHDRDALWASDGRFYRLMPHGWMAGLFGAAALYAALAMVMGFRNFWLDIGRARLERRDKTSIMKAVGDILTLRYLDGGGVGCMNENETPDDRRRLFHHFAFYGFMLCFAATTAGTLFHYFLNMPAPYKLYQLPKILGTLGGISLTIGALGLLHARRKRDPKLTDESRRGMDMAFIVILLAVAVSGLILMLVRQTPALAIALALHLGTVFAFFLSMPYGRFVHGLYRAGALLRYSMEQRRQHSLGPAISEPQNDTHR
ncbi:MAG TPA: tricarballylate utilization 4Fe-4S protein TcuB [Aestuariivirga sp.]|nr:tricarballylate utilization 4Fe-4S protein TcuB [Aestuariivirga sp.]